MFNFKNEFTGETFKGSVEQLHHRLEGDVPTISDKSDTVKSYGWSWDEKKLAAS